MLRRFTDWPERLAAFIASRKDTEFQWGGNDCALFACDAILTITGEDIGRDFRGYLTKAGALQVIADGGGSLEVLARWMCENNGMLEIKPAFAQRGDVVLFEGPFGPTMGIVSLDGALIASPGLATISFSPIASALTAWRVG